MKQLVIVYKYLMDIKNLPHKNTSFSHLKQKLVIK